LRLIVKILIIFLLSTALYAQPVTGGTGPDALTAADEFRLGVHAFNRFSYNEAILSFERALSFRPGEPLILDWLGKAYYRSGFEETALRQWRAALDVYGRNSGIGMLLNARIETVANRRYLMPVADDGVRYVGAGKYPGKFNDTIFYRQPTSILANNDGSVWIVAFGSNEIVRVDVNGIIRERRRGPINGFDRPYDLVRGHDGRMYLSEYRGSRVSVLDANGNWLSYIGSRGLKPGQLVGPQHLTIDEDGYLYVVDYGNRRVSKFDPDGAYILSFGTKSSIFPGMLSPTGIAAGNSRIYVADNAAKSIYMFDPNGNYIGRLAAENLQNPESLRFLSDGTILAVDGNRVIQIDLDSAIVRELGITSTPSAVSSAKVRITGADMDRNGSIVTADFNGSEAPIFTRFDDLASGFFVQIRNVDAKDFPRVIVQLTVEDRLRRPIVGLDNNNFLITEGGRYVAEQTFFSPGFNHQGADFSLLIERSAASQPFRGDLTAASRDISRALQEMGNSNIVSVVSAGTQPRREQLTNTLENAVRGSGDSYSPRWRFDLALRLAATDLLNAAPKRSVVYIGSGGIGDLAFEQYSLSEMTSYLANNGISFNAIIIGGGEISAEIEYLCGQTGGKAMHLFRPRGIGELIKSAADAPSGLYSLTYNSNLPTDFGRAWLPVEAEVYLLERSGRDNTGYFPPLE